MAADSTNNSPNEERTPIEELASCALKETSDGGTLCDYEKYKDAFNLLWPDAEGTVHKDKLLDFFKNILGSLYSEEMASCLLESMNPDENGNITMENFVHAFSLAYWTPESVAAMHNVLVTNPEIVSKLADWKNIFGNLGLEMNDQEVNNIIKQAQTRAIGLLSAELERSSSYSEEDKEEVLRKSGQILESIHAKLSSMDLEKIALSSDELNVNQTDEEGDKNVQVDVANKPEGKK